jgi:hypothetical protein
MGPREARDMNQEQRDAKRYSEAANLALEQLDWVIGLLHQLRKPGIAEVLEKNRRTIAKRYGL